MKLWLNSQNNEGFKKKNALTETNPCFHQLLLSLLFTFQFLLRVIN